MFRLAKEQLADATSSPRPGDAATTATVQQIRDLGKRARQAKKKATRKWEDEYWTNIADKADEA